MKKSFCKLIILTAALGAAMDANAQTITTVAGMGPALGGSSGDGGPATAARIGGNIGITLDASGNLYFSGQSTVDIRKVTAATGIITTIAGGLPAGGAGYAGDGGPAIAARFGNPGGMAFDGAGNLYIADGGNNVIRRINPSGIISTVAGGGTTAGDGIPATMAELTLTTDVAINGAGDIYIAEGLSERVRKVSHATGIITTVAGGGTTLGDGGPATAAQIAFINHIALDASGNLYIADADNFIPTVYAHHRVRKVNAVTGIITTVAGNGTPGYSGDGGMATAAQLNGPDGIAVDAAGNIFIGDSYNYVVRKVNTAGIISTVVGNNMEGYSGDGGPATAAELSGFNEYMALALDAAGNLFIADYDNNVIRKVGAATVTTPTAPITGTATLCAGATTTLADATTGGTWSSGNTAIATVGAATGVVTGVAGGTAVITYTVGTSSVTQVATVGAPPAAVTGAGSVCRGHTITLSDATAGGAWSSGSTAIATVVVGTGVVTGVAAGTAHITYTTSCGTAAATVTVSATPCATGIEEPQIAGDNIQLYPNPVTRELTVTTVAGLSHGGGINSITIYNFLGQTVYTHEYNADEVQVNVAALPTGVYFIKMNGTTVRKFLKE